MITVIEGRTGSGATGIMAKLVKERSEEAKKKIYADAPFSFDCVKFDLEEIGDMLEREDLENCIIALDYKYTLYDSRLSQSKSNRLLACIASKAQELGLDIFLTCDHVDYVDLRIRRKMDYRIKCAGINSKNEIPIRWINMHNGRRSKRSIKLEEISDLCSAKIIPLNNEEDFFGKVLGLEFSDLGEEETMV